MWRRSPGRCRRQAFRQSGSTGTSRATAWSRRFRAFENQAGDGRYRRHLLFGPRHRDERRQLSGAGGRDGWLSDRDVEDETVSLDRALHAMDRGRRAPQARAYSTPVATTLPRRKWREHLGHARRVARGLARGRAFGPLNTLIAVFRQGGSAGGSDGDSGNSPFAAALADHIVRAGRRHPGSRSARCAMMFMASTSKSQQEPFINGSLGGATLMPKRPPLLGRICPGSACRRRRASIRGSRKPA